MNTEATLITLTNVRDLQKYFSVIKKQRVFGSIGRQYYQLLEPLNVILSNNETINIPAGFTWDLSSVPKALWGLFPPDGDFELAALIHDYLYITQKYSRKFADNEMFVWSKALSSTKKLISNRNIDNFIRFHVVRMFGWTVWNRRKKKIKKALNSTFNEITNGI